jgi:uncharacterized protein YndB with AHSA1/START domain
MTTTTKGTAKVTTPEAHQILITREFQAPPALVWRAYTTPELIKRWWAGQRGTVTSAEVDLRVGGRWRYVMDAGGHQVAFRGEYREIEEPARLVTTEIYEGLPDPDDHASVVTATFASGPDGRTTVQLLCEYRDQGDRDAVLATGMEGGMQESLDALDEVATGL